MAKQQEEPLFRIDDVGVSPYPALDAYPGDRVMRVYEAEAIQGDVRATITVSPYGLDSDRYILYTGYDRVNTRASGALGYRQTQRGKALLEVLLERVRSALVAAGWQVRHHTPHGDELWSYEVPAQSSQVEQEQLSAEVPSLPEQQPRTSQVSTSAGYSKVISTRSITFTCQVCGQTVTQQRFPGPAPRYCSETCSQEAVRELTRARARRLRARRKMSVEVEEHEYS